MYNEYLIYKLPDDGTTNSIVITLPGLAMYLIDRHII